VLARVFWHALHLMVGGMFFALIDSWTEKVDNGSSEKAIFI
jgi:hypothetical protein